MNFNLPQIIQKKSYVSNVRKFNENAKQSFWQVLEKIVACGQAALPDKTLENQNKMARNFKLKE